MGCRNVDGSSFGGTPFVLPNTVVFTASGTYTPSVGVQYIEVFVIGGGGGGGGGSTTFGGAGGGAGCPSAGFYAPSVKAVVVGTGGAGGAAGATGINGIDSSFGGTLLVSDSGKGGLPGNVALLYCTGGDAGTKHVSAMYSLARQPGSAPDVDQGGCGGANYFGSGGRAFFNTASSSAIVGEAGSGYGGGGAGATHAAVGGAGSNGAVVVIEHF